jgi:branched-chain amino acid transport system substrate-binding protein
VSLDYHLPARLLGTAGAMAGLLLLTGQAVADELETANIGVIVQLTGASADYGKGIQTAVEMAKDTLKADGIINLQVFYEDSQQSPQVSVTAFQRLIDQHGIVAVMANGSPVNLALNTVAKSRHVIVYNFNAVSPALRNLGEWIINGNALGDQDGAVLSKYMLAHGKKSAGLISENSEFGVAVGDAFNKAYEAGGGKIVDRESNDEGNVDLRTQLLKIKNANPDSLVIFANIPENGYAIAQAKEVGLDVPVFANEFLPTPSNYKVAGAALTGVKGVSPKFDPAASGAKDFTDKFTRMDGRAPTASDALAYDGARLLGEAIAKVGTDSQAIRKRILTVKDWPGAVGKFNFDSDGVAVLPFSIYEITDGAAGAVTFKDAD